MDSIFGGFFVLVMFLIWTIGSILPFVVIGFIIYRIVVHARQSRPGDSRVATPFLSTTMPVEPVYHCAHCDSTVEKSSSCPNCGAPIDTSLPVSRG